MKNKVDVVELKSLKKGSYFKIIRKDGSLSSETYIKGYYDSSSKKFDCDKCSDIWGSGREFKGTQKVTTDFDY